MTNDTIKSKWNAANQEAEMIAPYWQQEEKFTKSATNKNNMEEENWDDQEKDRHFSWRYNWFLDLIREEEEEEEWEVTTWHRASQNIFL